MCAACARLEKLARLKEHGGRTCWIYDRALYNRAHGSGGLADTAAPLAPPAAPLAVTSVVRPVVPLRPADPEPVPPWPPPPLGVIVGMKQSMDRCVMTSCIRSRIRRGKGVERILSVREGTETQQRLGDPRAGQSEESIEELCVKFFRRAATNLAGPGHWSRADSETGTRRFVKLGRGFVQGEESDVCNWDRANA